MFCLIPHMSEIIWYLSSFIWLGEFYLFVFQFADLSSYFILSAVEPSIVHFSVPLCSLLGTLLYFPSLCWSSHSSVLLLWLLSIFIALLWTLYQVGCFSISSRPFFWDLSYSSISSFCLTLWVRLYVLDKTSAFCSLEEVVSKGRSVEDEPWGLECCPSHPLEPGAQRSSLVWTAGPRWWWWNLSPCTGSWGVMQSPCANVAWLWHGEVKHTGHTPGLHVVQLLMQSGLDAGSLPSCSCASVWGRQGSVHLPELWSWQSCFVRRVGPGALLPC